MKATAMAATAVLIAASTLAGCGEDQQHRGPIEKVTVQIKDSVMIIHEMPDRCRHLRRYAPATADMEVDSVAKSQMAVCHYCRRVAE